MLWVSTLTIESPKLLPVLAGTWVAAGTIMQMLAATKSNGMSVPAADVVTFVGWLCIGTGSVLVVVLSLLT